MATPVKPSRDAAAPASADEAEAAAEQEEEAGHEAHGHTPPKPSQFGENTPAEKARRGGKVSSVWKVVKRLKGDHPALAREKTHVCLFHLKEGGVRLSGDRVL